MPAAKKLINVFFSLVLIVGLLPTAAFAFPGEEAEESVNGKAVVIGSDDVDESSSGSGASSSAAATEDDSASALTSEQKPANADGDSGASASQDAQNNSSEQGDSDLENSWRYTNGVLTVQDDNGGIDTYSGGSARSGKSVVRKGIDVSEHNGTIDWDKAKADGVDFAILRIGFIHDNGRGRSDYQWERNVSECERLGIPYGVYVYSYAETSSHASTEADFVLQRLKGHNPSYPVYYDLEDNCQLSVAQNHGMGALAQAFCDKIAAAGYTPGIYANTNWWTNYLTDSCFNNWEKWVAQYNTSCTYRGSYSVWQYTSSGHVNGIDGNVDMNFDYEKNRKIGQFTIEDRFSELSTSNSADVKDGEYLIQSKLSSKSVIRCGGSGSAAMSALALNESSMQADQKFIIERDSESRCYRIKSRAASKYLSLSKSGNYYSPNILLRDFDEGDSSQLWKIEGTADGIVVIKSAINDSYCLDVSGASVANGTPIALYAENGSDAQRFNLLTTSPAVEGGRTIADGVYTVAAKSDPSKVLDVADASSADGANLQLWASTGAANQKFRFACGEDGFYTITCLKSGKVLDVADGNLVPCANVQQWSGYGGDAQKWAVREDGNGGYLFVCKANGLALDLTGGSTSNGANAQSWTLNGTDAQSFGISSAKAERAVADGVYVVSSAADPSKVLDVEGGSPSDGARLQVYGSNMTKAQQFDFSYDDETGFYTITNVGSGKVLDAAGGSTSNGTAVQQYSSNGTLAQRWIVSRDGDGLKICSAAAPSQVLDLTGRSSADGTKVQLWESSGSSNQRFNLYSTVHEEVPSCSDLGLGGWFEMAPANQAALRVDVEGASRETGAGIQIYDNNSTLAQLFKLECVNGYYRILSANSGEAIALRYGSVVPGIQACQMSVSDGDEQLFSVVDGGNGTYHFICKANGLMLGCSSCESGNPLVGCEESNGLVSAFSLVGRDSLLPEGLVSIAPSMATNKVLDVKDGSSADNANVQLYDGNGTFAQKWNIEKIAGRTNAYWVESVCSGRFLSVDGSNVCQKAFDGSSEGQVWFPLVSSSGGVIFKNSLTGKVLDISGASTVNGANVQVYDSNGTDAQRFYFEPTEPLPEATYAIHTGSSFNQVIDVSSASASDGANIQVWASNDSGAQKWNICKNNDGSYRIINAANGKALDVPEAKAYAGANVQQYTWNGSAAQKWIVRYGGNAGFVFSSLLDKSLVLEVHPSTAENGANVQLGKASDRANQRFCLEKTTYVPPMPADKQAMQDRIWGYSSGTQWLIAVDRSTHKVGVFRGSANNWSLQYYWSCVTGAPSTPTITGTYRTTGFKRTELSTDSRARWCTQIWGGYFFHTILVSEGELGQSLSHGCLRMSYPSAQWIYNNVYAGTTVAIYN